MAAAVAVGAAAAAAAPAPASVDAAGALAADPVVLDAAAVAGVASFSSLSVLNSKREFERFELPLGFVLQPAALLNPPPPLARRSPIRCSACTSYLNAFCRVETRGADGLVVAPSEQRWRCPFCGEVNLNRGDVDLGSAESAPEVQRRVVEFLDPCALDTAHLRVPYLFVVDGNAPQQLLQSLRRSLAAVLADLPPASLVGLVVFTHNVSVYDMGAASAAACNTIPGKDSPQWADVDFLFEHAGMLGPVREAAPRLLQCLNALAQCAKPASDQSNKLLNPRAIGPAVEVALAQACRYSDAKQGIYPGAHIVVCTTGAPDYGPGLTTLDPDTPENEAARKFFNALSLEAENSRVSVHVFCAGPGNFSVPVLRKLVSSCGGALFLYADFAEQFSHDLWLTLFRSVGLRGVLEVRLSSPLGVSRVIGGVTHLVGDSIERNPSTEESAQRLVFKLAAVQPDECLSFYFRPLEDVPGDFVNFQFVLSYTDLQQNRVTRVITHRLRTTGNPHAYIDSMDAQTIAVLMAKRSVLLATHGERSDDAVVADLDTQLRNLFRRLGRVTPDGVAVLPQPLQPLPRLLYALRRGPLLGPILQHQDDITTLRLLFLRSNVIDCARMMMPALLSFDAMGDFEELPLESLAMQSGRILMLDHHTHIFIWSGRYVTSADFDVYREACRQRAEEASRYRLPCPQILLFTEGSSEERWLACRLAPSHKDPVEIQVYNFPQLQRLGDDQLAELRAKLLPTDDPSFVEYYQSLLS
jgi:hypothetical protein